MTTPVLSKPVREKKEQVFSQWYRLWSGVYVKKIIRRYCEKNT